METIQALRAATSLNDLAHLLQYKPSGLAYIVYKIPDSAKYKIFEIPKKSGGSRLISAPCVLLKNLQGSTSILLQKCLEELEIERKIVGKSIVHGFKKKYSIVTNAFNHRNRFNVLNVDIQNFFGEINFGRVRGFFLASNDFKLQEPVATLLAQIACYNNCLPQGSPCSPVISNLIAHILDIRLAKLAARSHARYTRYADDLTFSTNLLTISSNLAVPDESGMHRWVAASKLRKELKRFNFSINDSKTRLQYCRSRQTVTGLVSNKKVGVRQEYCRTARAMANKLFKTGSYYSFAKKDFVPKVPGTIASLRGIFSFIDHVDRLAVLRIEDAVRRAEAEREYNGSARVKLYRKLVFFSDFYMAEKPVILFEGKTDRTYFKCAIQSLVDKYPLLAKVGGSGIPEIKVKIHKGGGVAKRFFELDSGASGLASFIRNYSENWKGLTAPGATSPVIVVVDGDDGFKPVAGAMKKYGKAIDDKSVPPHPYIWVCHNLYVVKLPGNKTPENLFPPALLKEKLSGKTFNPKNEEVSGTEYGKAYFAQYVVLPNKKTIDFEGFVPVLNAISDVIKLHGDAIKALA